MEKYTHIRLDFRTGRLFDRLSKVKDQYRTEVQVPSITTTMQTWKSAAYRAYSNNIQRVALKVNVPGTGGGERCLPYWPFPTLKSPTGTLNRIITINFIFDICNNETFHLYLPISPVGQAGCSDNESEFSENYDIPWKISTITAVSPLSAVPVAITIQGENLGLRPCLSTILQSEAEICNHCRNCNQYYNYCPKHRKSLMTVLNCTTANLYFEKKFIPILVIL